MKRERTNARRTQAGRAEARDARKRLNAERKAEKARLKAEDMRRRRRLRRGDVTVVEESTLKKAIFGSVVGNIMEWYDVGVYGYLAVILGQLFLPDASSAVQNLFSLAVFSVTFIARPVGGVILGQLGDRLGRKEVLAFTLTMMALATTLIGILPTYAAIGAAAPILLIALKLIQGFSTGGEYAGATTFITEYAPDKKRGFYSSLLDWGSYMGYSIGAALVSTLQLTVTDDFMNSWGWRIPFLIALPMGAIALYFRTHIEDTPAFVDSQGSAGAENDEGSEYEVRITDIREAAKDDTQDSPKSVAALVRTYWRELLTAFFLVASANTIGYALTSYMPTYLTSTMGYDAAHGNLLTLPILLLVAFMIPCAGWISDHTGRRVVMFAGMIVAIVGALPAFKLINLGHNWATILGLFLLALPVALLIGNQSSTLPAMFPTSSRYGGMGISFNLAIALLGGTAGLIMEALVTATGNQYAPAWWIIFLSVIGLVATTQIKESARRPLPGSMPSVETPEEAEELVATQEENPDVDVESIFAHAPFRVISEQPTVKEALAELEVARANEREAREALRQARKATANAVTAVKLAKREDHEIRRADRRGLRARLPRLHRSHAAAGTGVTISSAHEGSAATDSSVADEQSTTRGHRQAAADSQGTGSSAPTAAAPSTPANSQPAAGAEVRQGGAPGSDSQPAGPEERSE